MICCHVAYKFIWIPLVFTQIVTQNEFYTCLPISGVFWNFFIAEFILNNNNEHAQRYSCPRATFAFCSHGEKLPWQGGLPSIVQQVPRLQTLSWGNEKLTWKATCVRPCTEAKLTPGSVSCPEAMSRSGIENYRWVMIAPRQSLPRVHMMICCPGAMLPQVNSIALGQVQRNLITTDLSEFLYFLHKLLHRMNFIHVYLFLVCSGTFLLQNLFWTIIMSMRNITLAPRQLLHSVHMEKSYLGKAGYPVLYNRQPTSRSCSFSFYKNCYTEWILYMFTCFWCVLELFYCEIYSEQ